jgi:hypothetical protein
MSSSRTDDWFTPPHVIARVVAVLGSIDLDPCSDDARTVPAAVHYDRRIDGLAGPWHGKVFCNPPYGRGSVIPRWLEKFAGERDCGRMHEGILLVPARTETEWFRILWGADALCFWHGRIQFGTSKVNAPFPSVLGYFGKNRTRFMAEFCDAGKVIYP